MNTKLLLHFASNLQLQNISNSLKNLLPRRRIVGLQFARKYINWVLKCSTFRWLEVLLIFTRLKRTIVTELVFIEEGFLTAHGIVTRTCDSLYFSEIASSWCRITQFCEVRHWISEWRLNRENEWYFIGALNLFYSIFQFH